MRYCLIILCAVLVSCGTTKELSEATPKAELAEDLTVFRSSDGLRIKSVLVKGHFMTLNVQYSGGCLEHKFRLVGSTTLDESTPPHRQIKLVHDNDGDTCRELIDDVLVFDITVFRIEEGEQILILEEYKEFLPFK